jgi:uncharacterized protein with PIN domain
MNIVDSSGWLAYFADEPNAKHFITPLKDTTSLVIPSVTIYEVFKVVLRETSENEALQAAAAMRKSCGSNSHAGDCRLKTKSGTRYSNGRQHYSCNSEGIRCGNLDSGFRF